MSKIRFADLDVHKDIITIAVADEDGTAPQVVATIAHEDRAVGIDVHDEEDSPALLAAFEDGIATTGEAPLALLVDNRPSNHVPEVDAALGHSMRIDATQARAPNKAHVEGATLCTEASAARARHNRTARRWRAASRGSSQ